MFLTDAEPPVVDYCQSPPIFLVTKPSDLAQKRAKVTWKPPIFHDNSLKDALDLTLVIRSGNADKVVFRKTPLSEHILPMETQNVLKYIAQDDAGNEASCEMKIKLQGTIFVLKLFRIEAKFETIFSINGQRLIDTQTCEL